MRALATDNAGNTTASTVQTNRRIDNTGPVVDDHQPARRPRPRRRLPRRHRDRPAGVSIVTFEYRQARRRVAAHLQRHDRLLLLRHDRHDRSSTGWLLRRAASSATDTLATTTTTSPTIVVIIDNTGPTATNVQAANGGTAGRIDAGDSVTFTWSEPMSPVSMLPAWNGTSTPIRVRVNKAGAADTLDLYNAAGTTKLNVISATQALRLQADWVSATANFNATMTMTGNTVTVTIGTLISGTIRTGVTTPASMIWNPSTASTDAVGNPTQATATTEGGGVDRDF